MKKYFLDVFIQRINNYYCRTWDPEENKHQTSFTEFSVPGSMWSSTRRLARGNTLHQGSSPMMRIHGMGWRTPNERNQLSVFATHRRWAQCCSWWSSSTSSSLLVIFNLLPANYSKSGHWYTQLKSCSLSFFVRGYCVPLVCFGLRANQYRSW